MASYKVNSIMFWTKFWEYNQTTFDSMLSNKMVEEVIIEQMESDIGFCAREDDNPRAVIGINIEQYVRAEFHYTVMNMMFRLAKLMLDDDPKYFEQVVDRARRLHGIYINTTFLKKTETQSDPTPPKSYA